jgi:hypothetical protein
MATPARAALSRTKSSKKPSRRPRATLAGIESLETRLALAQTVGLFVNAPGAQEGYTLFNGSLSPRTHLIDTNGQEVHSWTGTGGTTAVYLQEDGSILRNTMLAPAQRAFGSNGSTGRIEIIDWNNKPVWSYTLADSKYQLHHDSIRLPNGNILAIAWERFSRAEAIAMGRDPAKLNPATNNELWGEAILEIKPDLETGSGGTIVWEWHLTDHLVQSYDAGKPNYVKPKDLVKYPHRVNVNFVPTGLGADTHIADWAHFNAIAYNAKTDQILVSSREFSEVWMIDHSTTTAQAAGKTGGKSGKGGDLLWRYGNPQTWNAGTAANQQLQWQHNIHWIADGLPGAGNLLLFNNGWGRPNGSSWSSVMEIKPTTYGKAATVWSYGSPKAGFFSPIISGAQRQPNGNTLICEGVKGNVFEVTPAGKTVWRYVTPDIAGGNTLTQGASAPPLNVSGTPGVFTNLTFRALKYTASSPALAGRTLTPGKLVEKYPTFYATAGFYDPATRSWSLNHHADGTSTAVTKIKPGIAPQVAVSATALPLAGDFDGNGVTSTGVYDGATGSFRLDFDNDGSADSIVPITGAKSWWQPLAGNWDGVGGDDLGLYDPVSHTFRFYTLQGTQASAPFVTPALPVTWRPLAGDWNGDGKDTVGLYDPLGHTFYLNDKIDGSISAMTVFKTPKIPATWVPLAGDWNGDKKDTVGLYDPATRTVYLNNRIDGSITNLVVYSLPASVTAVPVAGNWGSFPQPKPAVSATLLAAAVSFDPTKPKTNLTVRP